MRERLRAARRYAVYYGSEGLGTLSDFEAVILQPDAHPRAELEELSGVRLAYLSLGEDPAGEGAPWARRRGGTTVQNEDWGTTLVEPAHPLWRERCLAETARLLGSGFHGLFLDTLDAAADTDPRGAADLVASLRAAAPEAPLVANRGFALLPEIAFFIDGVMFEALSTTWRLSPGGAVSYHPLSPVELEENARLAREARTASAAYGFARLALDYADTPELAGFAWERAAALGFAPCVSNRELTQLEEGDIDRGLGLLVR